MNRDAHQINASSPPADVRPWAIGLSAALLALLFLVSFSVGRFPVAVVDLIHLRMVQVFGRPQRSAWER